MIVVRMFISTAISYEHAVVSRPLLSWPLQASGTIDNVKASIQDKKDLPSDQRCLIFEGTQFVYGCTSLASNIQKEHTLHLVLCHNGGMPIAIKTLTIKAITFAETMDMIDTSVQLEDGRTLSEAETMNMLDTSQQLEAGRTLSDRLVSRMRRGMHLVVKTLTVKTITFAEAMDMIDISEQLEEGRTLLDRLVSRMRRGMHLVVKTLTVKAIKERLKDGRTLSDHNVQKENTLHLMLRPRGGMQLSVTTLTTRTITPDIGLADGRTLSETTLHLALCFCGGIRIFVKALTCKITTSDAETSDMIGTSRPTYEKEDGHI